MDVSKQRKRKKNAVKEPQQQKKKARFKWHVPHDDNITEKKKGFKLKEIYFGVWIFLFYDPCEDKGNNQKRKKERSLCIVRHSYSPPTKMKKNKK